jgi:hypothetical protein
LPPSLKAAVDLYRDAKGLEKTSQAARALIRIGLMVQAESEKTEAAA